MSMYNTELRTICESLCEQTEPQGYSDVEQIIDTSATMIFDFDFPLPSFVETGDNFKKNLAKKIIYHYYTREIGLETYGLWKLKLRTKMNEIMPYYCQLYESAVLNFNPFFDTDITTESNANRVTNSSNDSKAISKGVNSSNSVSDSKQVQGTSAITSETNKYSDTPQGGLSGIENDMYLTNARIVGQDSGATGISEGLDASRGNAESLGISDSVTRGTGTSMDAFIERKYGKVSVTKSYSELLEDFRKTFLNVDMMIIEELSDLFMLLW